MAVTIERLQHRLERLQEQRKQYDHPTPEKHYSFHGGQSIGYIDGKIAVLEEWIEELEEQSLMKEKLVESEKRHKLLQVNAVKD